MLKLTKSEKGFIAFSLCLSFIILISSNSNAMHVMEGYLPPIHCIVWIGLCLPFLANGIVTIRKLIEQKPRTVILLAMSGAFIFVISSLKIPSVTGSCSHMTGTGLGSILFGVGATSILGIIVLLFQAILLAHGGLTTLGANTFSMAIAGPIVTLAIYKIGMKMKLNKKVVIFLSAMLGDLLTYCVTSIQLAMAYPSETGGFVESATKFLTVFAPTQLPLSIIEGILTVLIVIGLESFASPELREIGFSQESI